MKTHRVAFTAGELEGVQVRVPVRSSNSMVLPGTFEQVDLESGRGRNTDGTIRARAEFPGGPRWVTLSSRYQPGDTLRVQVSHSRRIRLMRVLSVTGRRVRDVVGTDDFNESAWTLRHGAPAWVRNDWAWCLVLATKHER